MRTQLLHAITLLSLILSPTGGGFDPSGGDAGLELSWRAGISIPHVPAEAQWPAAGAWYSETVALSDSGGGLFVDVRLRLGESSVELYVSDLSPSETGSGPAVRVCSRVAA